MLIPQPNESHPRSGIPIAVILMTGASSAIAVAKAQLGVAYFARLGGFVAGLLFVKRFATGRAARP
jgi:membrane associated rhomboid family serine protease